MSLDSLRRFAVARSLFPPTTLDRAIGKLGFVQADPIRAPARAQDLTLRHRVKNYRAGDLDRRYQQLGLEEGFFINHGYMRRADYLRLLPRDLRADTGRSGKRVPEILAFIREQGTVHPRDIEARFGHGRAVNYWGGQSKATTHLLGIMHYCGLLRVARREAGIRIYALLDPVAAPVDADARIAHIDAAVDIVVGLYAPLPAQSLSTFISRVRWGAPQWTKDLKAAIARAKQRLAHGPVDGVEWYWPAGERPERAREAGDIVRLLSPFDPVVWDRRRFELLWKWAYRFEAYTPAPKRKLGYYALPLLWGDRVIGWGNAIRTNGRLDWQFGFVGRKPRERAFARELDAEVGRLEAFLVTLRSQG